MMNLTFTNLVLGGWLLIAVVRRQIAPRVIRFKANFYLLVILLGIASVADAFNKQHLQIALVQGLIFGGLSLVSAIGFALLRAWSYRFWVNEDGIVMRQGNWVTILWWVLGIGVHLGVDQLWTGSSVTLLLYLGLTLAVQRGWVWWLASRSYPNEIKANLQQQSSERHHRRRS